MDLPRPSHTGNAGALDPRSTVHQFDLDLGPEAARLTLLEVESGAILDTRIFPLTNSLWVIRVAAQEMWNNFHAFDHEAPLPQIRGVFHPSH